MRRTDPLPALVLALCLLPAALFHALHERPPAAPAPPLWRPDLNAAPPRHLVLLPGIGPVRARAIVAERLREPFTGIDDLRRVHGIGPATVDLLRDYVVVKQPR